MLAGQTPNTSRLSKKRQESPKKKMETRKKENKKTNNSSLGRKLPVQDQPAIILKKEGHHRQTLWGKAEKKIFDTVGGERKKRKGLEKS